MGKTPPNPNTEAPNTAPTSAPPENQTPEETLADNAKKATELKKATKGFNGNTEPAPVVAKRAAQANQPDIQPIPKSPNNKKKPEAAGPTPTPVEPPKPPAPTEAAGPT